MASKIKIVAKGLSVAPIYWAIQKNPGLWNQHTSRTENQDSPHFGLDDIWARFGDPQHAKDGAAHDSVWYPSADILKIKPLCYEVMKQVCGDELGGVLITRIPPGRFCKPHTDPGWHARRYQKFAVQITSAPTQQFCFEGEHLETKPGDLFWFDNQYTHWVINDTPYERVTMIVCIRLDESSLSKITT